MEKEEYYKRIGKINSKFKTDRVSADEEYQLVCQKDYLSTKYIENLEQQCKKQKEVIDKAKELIEHFKLTEWGMNGYEPLDSIQNILNENEVSE